MKRFNRRKLMELGLLVFIFAVVLYLIFGLKIFNKENIESIAIRAENDGPLIYLLIVTGLLVFFVPLTWFTLVAAVFLGWKGYLLTILAALIGSVIAFFIGKVFSDSVKAKLYEMNGKRNNKFDLRAISDQLEEYGRSYVFFIRSVPLTPYTLINYISGISNINFLDYLSGSILGIGISESINVFFMKSIYNIGDSFRNFLFWGFVKLVFTVSVIVFHRRSRKSY